jgi:hypothetical protein
VTISQSKVRLWKIYELINTKGDALSIATPNSNVYIKNTNINYCSGHAIVINNPSAQVYISDIVIKNNEKNGVSITGINEAIRKVIMQFLT